MAQYAGDPDAFPVDMPLPDDSAAPTAAEVNPMLEGLADRTAYLQAHSPRIKSFSVTASGPIVVPARVTFLIGWGWGGGGGGGSGAAGVNSVDNRWMGGGGAGGSAIPTFQMIAVTPGETLDVEIGAGGVGSTVSGTNGASGGDTVIKRAGVAIATFGGAGGGSAARGGHVVGLWEHIVPGGTARPAGSTTLIGVGVQNIRYDTSDAMWGISSLLLQHPPGTGGFGADGSTHPGSGQGERNLVGAFAGGTPGARGGDIGDARGGGGGGGGAAGPGGAGGAGGAGGTVAVAAGAGNSGAAAGANTGAGGGGGGSAGYNAGSSSAGGNGGNGGSGKLTYAWVMDEAA